MERLSERGHLVLEAAEDEALRLDHPHTGTEHILLGLFSVDGPARNALLSAGATVDGARAKVIEAVGERDPRQKGRPDLSARARRAIDRADRLSLQRRDPHLEPEHLLVGVLDVEGRAGQVLRGLGVDVGGLQIDARLCLEEPPPVVPTRARPVRPVTNPECPYCRSDLAEGLAYRVVEAGDGTGERHKVAVVLCEACGTVLGVVPVEHT